MTQRYTPEVAIAAAQSALASNDILGLTSSRQLIALANGDTSMLKSEERNEALQAETLNTADNDTWFAQNIKQIQLLVASEPKTPAYVARKPGSRVRLTEFKSLAPSQGFRKRRSGRVVTIEKNSPKLNVRTKDEEIS